MLDHLRAESAGKSRYIFNFENPKNLYLDESVRTLPGVLHLTVSLIERTKPLVSYDEWSDYSAAHPSWDPAHMINQFGRA